MNPLDTPLSLVPRVKVSTVHSPGVAASTCATKHCKVHTSDWRETPGSPLNRHGVRALKVTTIGELFERQHDPEALVMGYVLARGGAVLGECPRIAKESLPWIREQGFDVWTRCYIGDIDTPGHVAWTPEMLTAWEHTWATAPSLQTCAGYLSGRGARVLQPLDAWMPADEAEPRLRAWLQQLVDDGVWPSVLECKDWTHLMRVPSPEAPWASTERLRAIAPPEPLYTQRVRPVRRATRAAAPGVSVLTTFTDAIPPGWAAIADAVGAAIATTVTANWRRCYMALAGALCARGCPVEGIPAVVARAHAVDRSYPTWESLLSDRATIARDAVARHHRGDAMLGYNALRAEFSAVADALDGGTISDAEARVLRQIAAPVPPAVSLDVARAQLAERFEAPYGVEELEGPPGIGKTFAGVARAMRLPVFNERAPTGARWAWSVPDHKLGAEVYAAGDPVRTARIFSPLAHRTDGAPTCIHYDQARPLVNGGQSLEWEFCQGRGKSPCEKAQTCEARPGWTGPKNANLVIGPHALLGALDELAGVAGALVVDEPGEVVLSEVITPDQLATALRYIDAFATRYQHAITPALSALDAWAAELGAVERMVPITQAIREGAGIVSTETLLDAGISPDLSPAAAADEMIRRAREAIEPKARVKSPPIQAVQMGIARRSPGRAAELGAASRVLNLFWRALVAEVEPGVRVDRDRSITLTRLDEAYVRAHKRQGPMLKLDANAAIRREATTKATGAAPNVFTVRVVDRAPTRRTVLACSTATRSTWFPRGVPAWDAGLLSALRAVVAWANETPGGTVALFSWEVLEAAVLHALSPDAPAPVATWLSKGQPRSSLDVARAELAPVLAELRATLVTGHYGNVRGSNAYADCDASITLGDPRPNLGAEADACEFLGIDPSERLDLRASAELEQAHGRLRTITREKPARMLHVGVVARFWAGYAVDVRPMPTGRPKTAAAMSAEEFRFIRQLAALSQADMARALRVSPGAVKHYEGDRRPVPSDVATAARSLVPVGSKTPFQKVGSQYGGFGSNG